VMKDSLFFPFGSLFDGCFRTQHRQKLVLNALMNSHASPAAMVPANREIVRLGLNLAKEDELAEAISPASEKFCQGLPIQRSILIPVRPVRTHHQGQARAPGAWRSLRHGSRAAADSAAGRLRFSSGCCCCFLIYRFSSQHSTSGGARPDLLVLGILQE
jgi:hypothetical protein